MTGWLGAALLAVGLQSPAVEPQEIQEWTATLAEAANIPALAVVVTDAEGTLVTALAGSSGAAEPLHGRSRFYIGSVTKTMTAMGVMRLVDRGELRLDAPLVRYLPELTFADPEQAARITVEHLLRHSSGIPTITAFNRRVQRTGRVDRVRLFAEPGSEVEYSSLNFQLLGMLIERVGGTDYADFMAREVFGPAGLEATTARRPAPEEYVQGHSYFFGFPVARDEPHYPELVIPAGYVVTTPEDMAAYMRVLLREGSGEAGRVLSADAVAAIRTPRTGEYGVGLGWGVTGRWGTPALSHSGMTPGFYSTVAIFPEEGLGIAVLAARNAGPFLAAPEAVLDGVVRIVQGVEPKAYVPWERIIRFGLLAAILFDLVRTGRLARAWGYLGRPRSVAHTTRVVGRLVFDLAVAAALPLWIILGLAKLPIQAFFEFYPDFGIALVLWPLMAVPAAVLRALVTSARWRRSERETAG